MASTLAYNGLSVMVEIELTVSSLGKLLYSVDNILPLILKSMHIPAEFIKNYRKVLIYILHNY